MPKSEAAIAESAQFIRIMSLAIGCIGFQHVINGTLRGAGNTLAAMVLSIIAAWVIQFPLAYILSRHTSLGIDGIWWAYPISMVVSAIISLLGSSAAIGNGRSWSKTWSLKSGCSKKRGSTKGSRRSGGLPRISVGTRGTRPTLRIVLSLRPPHAPPQSCGSGRCSRAIAGCRLSPSRRGLRRGD